MRDLNNIVSKNILVIGDIMLDTYYTGDVKRISPEAPVPVFRKKKENSVLGGAANVAANLVAAGQSVSVMAIVGDDPTARKLIAILDEKKINTDLLQVVNRPTTEKVRFLATNNQQVMRLDIEDSQDISDDECGVLLDKLKGKISTFDLILISDYLKGLLTYNFTQEVIKLANKNAIPVVVDVKDPKFEKYSGATLIKPNIKELQDLTGDTVENDEEIIAASEKLREQANCEYVLTTCGGRGMVLVGYKTPYFIEAVGHEVFDVTGAGDTTIAYLAACMVNDFSMTESVDIANVAAGIQVSKVGTSSVFWTEIRNRISDQANGSIHKIIKDKTVLAFRKEHDGQKIVFTNGCFDILHIGHARYLQEAAKLGDILIVGVNSDKSVKRLKGPERPINKENDRAELLAGLSFVDYVVIFDEDTPYELIRKIQPDILVKGGDYKADEVVGKDYVESRGGHLVLIPFVEGKSTTNIINKIKE